MRVDLWVPVVVDAAALMGYLHNAALHLSKLVDASLLFGERVVNAIDSSLTTQPISVTVRNKSHDMSFEGNCLSARRDVMLFFC